jgi:cyclopropane fatty-acyl-phospholipid synthase-like methyltransferase
MSNDSERKQASYAMGHSSEELARLERQAAAFEPVTRMLLGQAGLRAGMRVLDVGSGAGDVSFVAAAMVGPSGSVVGVDRAAPALSLARARAAARGADNVTFVEADPASATFDEPFDAVVGRFVLMYQPDPSALLRAVSAHLRPGGLVAFQEYDFSGARTFPEVALVSQCRDWLVRGFTAGGVSTTMGLDLHRAFRGAGLPVPTMRLDAAVTGGSGGPSLVNMAGALRSLLPVLERAKIVSAAELDLDTLPARLEKAVQELDAVVIGPPIMGAFCRVP